MKNPFLSVTQKDRRKLDLCVDAEKNAVRDLLKSVQQCFPLGSRIKLKVHHVWITAEVVRHETWSNVYAGYITLRNLKTGKERHVHIANNKTVEALP